MPPGISVIVLAFGDEPHLSACVAAILADPSTSEVVLVDNGAGAAVAALPPDDRVRVVRPDQNAGFAGGCNVGAAEACGDVLAFVNSDAVVERGALTTLAAALDDPTIGIVCGCVLLADDPATINSVGNPVHFTGLAWAGGYGEPAANHAEGNDVTSFTGALFATTRPTWEALGGFAPSYFAYHEDVELSLRAWRRGLRVRYVPQARATHHYEFSRNATKLYLLERNRLMTVLTTYPRRVLWRLAPALVVFELLMCATALSQGWLRDKLRGYVWLLKRAGTVWHRRSQVQAQSVLADDEFARLLHSQLQPGNVETPRGLVAVNALLSAYFRLVSRSLSRS